MLAVVEIGGKQYFAEKGKKLQVEKLDTPIGEKVMFDKVLLTIDGNALNVGKPLLAGATVEGKVLKTEQDDKVMTVKFKKRKSYRRRIGHRQYYTEIEIVGIKA